MAMSYEEVARRLGRQASVQLDKRRGTEFRIAPTHLEFLGNPDDAPAMPDLQVRYHGTAVVTLHPDHTYTLRTGGMATKTLLRRISEYSPVTLTVRGGTVLYQDRTGGDLLPFEEGLRVDARGRRVRESVPHDEPTPPITTEDGVKVLLNKLLNDKLEELGLAQPREKPAPVRSVSMAAVAEEMNRPTADGPTVDIVVLIEQAMRTNGLPEDQITRIGRDFRAALHRGRDATPETPAPRVAPKTRRLSAPAPVSIMRCPDCKGDMREHYDRANRYRGCSYAARQHGDQSQPRR